VISSLLALASAFSFGWSDFAGGIAAKRAPATVVVAFAHAIGLVVAVSLAVAFPGDPVRTTWIAGAGAGVSGAVGLVALYRGLATGRMALVAPVSALIATALPVMVGFSAGDRLGGRSWICVGTAIVAIVLVSATGRLAGSGMREAAVAGLGFAGFFLALSVTDVGEGLWPLVPARATSLLMLTVVVLGRGGRLRLEPSARAPTLLAGVGDVAANALYLAAVQRGLLTSTVVLSSLYPVVTVIAGRLVLKEDVAQTQWVGIALAVVAVALMAV
jgi:drug/metabolite transporter (DMT)-like permease